MSSGSFWQKPVGGSTHFPDEGSVEFRWGQDGEVTGYAWPESSQLEYRFVGGGYPGTWTTVNLGEGIRGHSVPVSGHVECVLEARARSKYRGMDGYSAWSETTSVIMLTRPSATLTVDSATYPVKVNFGFSSAPADPLASATLTVKVGSATRAQKTVTKAGAYRFSEDEIRANPGDTIAVTVDATSDRGLAAPTVTATVTASLNVPPPPELFASARDGYAEIRALAANSRISTGRIVLARVNRDGTQTVLADVQASDTGVVIDHLPPLDVPVTYVAMAYGSGILPSSRRVSETVPSGGAAHFNWRLALSGTGHTPWEYRALCRRKATFEQGRSRERETFATANRERPMVFFGTHVESSPSVTGDVPIHGVAPCDPEESTEAFERMRDEAGIVCVRFPYSQGFKAFCAADVRISISNERYLMATVTVDCTEVDHEMA